MAGTVPYPALLANRLRATGVLLACLLVSAPAAGADCVTLAAERYQLPAPLIRAILAVEGGRVGLASGNSNGTQDLGPMQINTIWLPELAGYGVTREQLQNDRCINILAGSWILARQFKVASELEGSERRRFWWAVGSYHSRTPELNVRYALKVWQVLQVETSANGG